MSAVFSWYVGSSKGYTCVAYQSVKTDKWLNPSLTVSGIEKIQIMIPIQTEEMSMHVGAHTRTL